MELVRSEGVEWGGQRCECHSDSGKAFSKRKLLKGAQNLASFDHLWKTVLWPNPFLRECFVASSHV